MALQSNSSPESEIPNHSWAAWTRRPAEQPPGAGKRNVKEGLALRAELALTTLAGNRCLPVLCCGLKQTLSYTRMYADILHTKHTESVCFLCFGRAGLLRSGRACATHKHTHTDPLSVYLALGGLLWSGLA